jgi:hypothetical protein
MTVITCGICFLLAWGWVAMAVNAGSKKRAKEVRAQELAEYEAQRWE